MEDKKQYTVTLLESIRRYATVTVYAGSEEEARKQIDLDRVDLGLFESDDKDESGGLMVYHVEEER